jgi:hypothetical protein
MAVAQTPPAAKGPTQERDAVRERVAEFEQAVREAPVKEKPIDWGYWNGLDSWALTDACKLISGENPAEPTQPEDIENPDTLARPAWVNLYHTAASAIVAKKLRYYSGCVDPKEFVVWAREKGVTIPDEVRPSTTIALDNEPAASRKAPDTFIAALICLIAEISKRAAENSMPFKVTEMPGTKADFRALAIKFDDKLEKASRTFDDYLAGLLRFKQGARETTFYQELFPEFFGGRGPNP